MTTYIPKKARKKTGGIQSVVLYLVLTLLALMLMGSFVSDNVYLSASKVTTDASGVVNEYRAAIGDGLYQDLPGSTTVTETES